ncbi:hypothetical protein L208DRAFT_1310127, partial [Tricholoma matsutake]
YPYVESVFEGAVLQPYIHDCTITVHEGHHSYCLSVFFKRHCRLQPNQSLHCLWGASHRGDVVVMRIGSNGCYVNMRDRDTILSDWFMQK